MKTIKKSLCVVLSVIMLLSLAVFSPMSASAKAKPKLNKKKVTITKGKTFKLKLKNAKASKVKWSSSKKSVATVKKGKITAKKKGKATITAKYKGKKYKCKVTVKPKVKSFGKTFTVYKNDTLKLTIKNNLGVSYNAKSWKSSNKSVATIDKNGLVKGKKVGTTIITAVDSNDDEIKGTVKVVDPFKALKDYLNKKGTTDADGNKYISYSAYDYNFFITYNNSTKKFDFEGTYSTSSYNYALTMHMGSSGTAKPDVLVEYNDEQENKYSATASLTTASYTSSTDLTFKRVSGNVTDEEIMNNRSNAMLQKSVYGWKIMLADKLDMNISAIGFTKYS